MSLGIDIEKDIGHLLFTFKDASVLLIRTTLNNTILGPVLKDRLPGHLYDLDKRRWIKIPDTSECSLTITKERPKLEEGHEFVNKYL